MEPSPPDLESRIAMLERQVAFLLTHPQAARVASPRAATTLAAPPRKPRRKVDPAQVLAALGGFALLLGLLFFVWYSVEQGWLTPMLRVVLGGLSGVGLVAGAWRMAPKQAAVAGALGGAGIGAWFGAWLVARHVHGFVGPDLTLIALGLGSLACLVVAGSRRLHLMAVLAAIGAFVAPLAVGGDSSRLHELGAYTLLVLVGLAGLEAKRHWPAPMIIGTVGTWVAFFAWMAGHVGPETAPAALVWACGLLVVQGVLCIASLRDGAKPNLVAVRIGLGGLLGATAAIVCAEQLGAAHGPAYVALGVAAWHALLAFVVRGRGVGPVATAGALGWLSLFVFMPLRFETPGFALGWSLMAGAALMAYIVSQRSSALAFAGLPYLATVTWAIAEPATTAGLWIGLGVTALGLVAFLVRLPHETLLGERRRGLGLLLAWSCLSAVAWAQLPPQGGGHWAPLWATAFGLGAALWVASRPTPGRSFAVLGILAIALWGTLSSMHTAGLLDPTNAVSLLALSLGVAAALACLLAALGLLASLRTRMIRPLPAWLPKAHDAAGLVMWGAAITAVMAIVTALVSHLGHEAARWSINQAGWSAVWAGASLVVLVAGLRLDRLVWRHAGLAGLAITATKLLFVDLAHVGLGLRVVSFVSLGACMILGAYAYRSAQAQASKLVPG